MSLERLFQTILYFGLLSGAMVFVIKSVNDFIQGDTGYTRTHELLTPHDIPALVFCFDKNPWTRESPVYRTDFSINFTIYNGQRDKLKTVVLADQKSVETTLGLDIFFAKRQSTFQGKRNCYVIQATWKGGKFFPMHRYRQLIRVQFLNPGIMPAEATWYVVSAKNFHGMILERFFDGNCEKNVL